VSRLFSLLERWERQFGLSGLFGLFGFFGFFGLSGFFGPSEIR
jgi:hypothetical protein